MARRIEINGSGDVITNVDRGDLSKDYLKKARGFRFQKAGIIGEGDFGTRKIHSEYPAGIDIKSGCIIVSSEDGEEYYVIAGVDQAENLRIWVHDQSWLEITEKLTATIGSIDGATVTLTAITDILGEAATIAIDHLQEWTAINQRNGKSAYIATNIDDNITLANQAITALGWEVGDTITLYRSVGLIDYQYQNGSAPHIRWLTDDAHTKAVMCYGDSESPTTARTPIVVRKAQWTSPLQLNSGWSGEYLANKNQYNGIHFADAQTGWICGNYGTILNTTDGGATWEEQTSGTTQHLRAIRFATSTDGWAIGDAGVILRTDNGGSTWTGQVSGVGVGMLLGISVIDENTAWICGTGGIILHTTNGGATWVQQTSGTGYIFRTIFFYNNLTGWAGGFYGRIYKTTNGGTTWAQVSTILESGSEVLRVWDIKFRDANNGWATCDSGRLASTADGGETWTVSRPYTIDGGTVISDIYSIDIYDATHYWTILGIPGLGAYIYATADGGTTWTLQASITQEYFTGIDIVSATAGHVCGSGGIYYRTISGGQPQDDNRRWKIERHQLNPNHTPIGALADPIRGNGAPIIRELGEGIAVKIEFSETDDSTDGSDNRSNIRMYITQLYGYQESDPILQLCLSGSATDKYPKATYTVYLDHSRLSKDFSGLRFYHARKRESTTPLANWIDAPADYLEAHTLNVSDTGWNTDPTAQYPYSIVVDKFGKTDIDQLALSGAPSIHANLNHAIDTNRSRFAPRYAAKAARSQGAVNVMDEGNQKGRLSAYDGNDIHQDDNYPDVSVDNDNIRQAHNLNGRGDLLGIAIVNGQIHYFFPSELEIRELVSDENQAQPIDCVAPQSIIETPHGIVWAGKSGIYLLPTSATTLQIRGGGIRLLNKNTQNWWDGTLKTGNEATPYLSNEQRSQALSGYDPTYDELWIQVPAATDDGQSAEYICWRYNFGSGRWNQRKLNIGTNGKVEFFLNNKSREFIIGCGTGLLRYPGTEGQYAYQDDVPSDGQTPGNGIERSLAINIGEIYNLRSTINPGDITIDHNGESIDGQGTLALDISYNDEQQPADQKTFRLDERAGTRRLIPRGAIEKMAIEISVPENQRANCKNIEISRMEIGYELRGDEGNR